MLNLRPLLNFQFWFDRTPAPLEASSSRLLFGTFAVMLILGAIIRMVATRRTEDRYVTATFNRVGQMAVTMGMIGLVLFFFTYQEIPFLGSRFWYLFWGVGLIAWITSIVYYIKKIVPEKKKQEAELLERSKYLPGKKQ